jgi:predicted regulator of Ras-like GTPase activity (Roadblock/LC7/MglB family)
VFQMANIVALEEILDKIKQNEGISDAVLVSRSGMHIAGNVPKGAHAETFVAMSAILLGAAETATSELKEKLRIVSIMLEQSKVAIGVVSPKAVLVLKADLDEADEKLLQILRDNSSKLESAL